MDIKQSRVNNETMYEYKIIETNAEAGFYKKRSEADNQKLLPEHARTHNMALVMQQLYTSEYISRAEISRKTGLTRVTVSQLVAELVEEEYAIETGLSSDNKPGKKATMLKLNPDKYHIIAINVSYDEKIIAGLYDLSAKQVYLLKHSISSKDVQNLEAIIIRIIEILKEKTTSEILGIAITSPGIIDQSGKIVAAPNLEWKDYDLAKIIQSRFKINSLVINDANAALIAERSFGGAKANTLLIMLGNGVGGAISVADNIVYGVNGSAGEFGHVSDSSSGPKCVCGKTGCLEAWFQSTKKSLESEEILLNSNEFEEFQEILGKKLGKVLAPIVSALDLEEIIVTASDKILGKNLLSSLEESISNSILLTSNNLLAIRQAKFGESAMLLGGVTAVLRREIGIV